MEKDESIECVRLLLEAGANPNISAGDKYQHYVRKTRYICCYLGAWLLVDMVYVAEIMIRDESIECVRLLLDAVRGN